MEFPILFLFISLLFFIDFCRAEEDLDASSSSSSSSSSSFYQNFDVSWGHDHVLPLGHGGNMIQLTMDEFSGCGIISKLKYGSGFFTMRLKLPERDSTAVVTTYYVSTNVLENPGFESVENII